MSQPDAESVAWVGALRSEGAERDRALSRLHRLLLRVARAEAARRRPRLPDAVVAELDDLCFQAASDALMAVTAKLDSYRGEARFTTWACKFVILELSTRVRRRAWRDRLVATDDAVWERLAATAPSALQEVQHRELLHAVRRGLEHDLTERQRRVFQSVVLEEVPIDVLAERLGSSRGAIYKTLHDARRRLRESLVLDGHMGDAR